MVFQSDCAVLHFHPQFLRFPVATHPHKDLICSVFIILDILSKYGSVLHCSFNIHFLKDELC